MTRGVSDAGETARAMHDEDLDGDTDFCAMCGHDWCSMRISKEVQEFASGKHAEYQPQRVAAQSPGLSDEQQKLLAERAKQEKLACHSDVVADDETAKQVQAEFVKLNASD